MHFSVVKGHINACYTIITKNTLSNYSRIIKDLKKITKYLEINHTKKFWYNNYNEKFTGYIG